MNTIADAAQRTFGRILEGAAFLFVDEASPDEAPSPKDWKPDGVGLVWSGPSAGRMELWSEPGFREVLAANMLGVDEDTPDAESKSYDALGEILNMLLGNTLTEAYGEAPVFHLETPQRLDSFQLMDAMDGECLWFQVEGRWVMLSIREDE